MKQMHDDVLSNPFTTTQLLVFCRTLVAVHPSVGNCDSSISL
jgi:hypothetical protein